MQGWQRYGRLRLADVNVFHSGSTIRLANISRCCASVFSISWRSFSNGLSTVWHANDGICWKLPGSAEVHTQLSMV
jgi:hypothetical protein